jgi:hypothetical protein
MPPWGGFSTGLTNPATLKTIGRNWPGVLILRPWKGLCAARLFRFPGMAFFLIVILICPKNSIGEGRRRTFLKYQVPFNLGLPLLCPTIVIPVPPGPDLPEPGLFVPEFRGVIFYVFGTAETGERGS